MEWKVYFPRSLGKPLILAMKLTVVLVLVCFLQLAATGFSQGITLSEKDARLEIIFTKIFRQTGFEFFYNSSAIEKAKPVSINVQNQTLIAVLDLCLRDQPLDYELHDKTVVIKEKLVAAASLITITGLVTSEDDEPLEGVTVRVKDSGKGAITDARGEFVLNNINDNAVLVISSVGFNQTEVGINGKPRLNIRLKLAVKGLDETVIVAYGKTSRRLSTGSVSKLDGQDIGKQPVSNPLEAMAGRIPGLFIRQTTGVSGGEFTVQIRGRNSILNGNDPLYIIDGVPFTSASLTSSLGTSMIGAGSPLNSINPADIESIEVLKDADATAIYGSRSANGIIMITTRKGKAGKTSFDLNVYSGMAKVGHFMDLLNTKQYLEMRHEAFANDGISPAINNARDLLEWDTTRYTDWQKKLIGGTARFTDIQASVSGGNANTQFLIRGGMHSETTIYPGDFRDRKGSLHMNLAHSSLNKKFKANLVSYYSVDHNNLFSYNLASYVPSLIPSAPAIYDENGQLNWMNGTFSNPYAELLKTYKATTSNLMYSSSFSYEVLAGLNVRTNLGYTRMEVEEIQANPLVSFNPFQGYTSANTSTSFGNNSIETWIIEPQVEYRRKLGAGTLNLLVGTTFQNDFRKGQVLQATGFSNDGLLENIAAASAINTTNKIYSQYRYEAIFGRISYNWQDKYLLNLTARRDGSSRFGPDKQFSDFGAVGAGWVFSKTSFIKKNVKFISFGKIRGSYGTTGSDQIPPYEYLSSWQSSLFPYQGLSGLEPARIGNPSYSWERNRKLQVAVDVGFFNDRLNFSVDYYRNRSSNQLIGYPLPGSSGFTTIQYNLPAEVENSGIEIDLYSQNLKGKNFSWSTSFNMTIPNNKLISFPGIEGSGYAAFFEVGQPLTVVKAFHLAGVDPQTGVYTFEDVNKDGSLTPTYPGDITAQKKIVQNYYGGLSNTLQYKNWKIDFFFQFVKQTGYNYMKSFGLPGRRTNQPTMVLSRWQKPGDRTDVEKFTQDFGSDAANAYYNNSFTGDGTIGDASFLRCKNIYLSYELPENKWKKKAGLGKLRIYLEGQNIFTITYYKGLDPETQLLSVPPLRRLAAGMQLSF